MVYGVEGLREITKYAYDKLSLIQSFQKSYQLMLLEPYVWICPSEIQTDIDIINHGDWCTE